MTELRSQKHWLRTCGGSSLLQRSNLHHLCSNWFTHKKRKSKGCLSGCAIKTRFSSWGLLTVGDGACSVTPEAERAPLNPANCQIVLQSEEALHSDPCFRFFFLSPPFDVSRAGGITFERSVPLTVQTSFWEIETGTPGRIFTHLEKKKLGLKDKMTKDWKVGVIALKLR